MRRPEPRVAALAGWAAAAAGLAVVLLADLPDLLVPALAAAGLAWLCLAFVLRRGDVPSRFAVAALVAAALLRLALFGADPRTLSDDVHRYLWDGRLVLSGSNPYDHAPRDERDPALRADPLYRQVPHPQYLTVYPPVAQGLFAAGTWLGGGTPLGMRLLWLLADIAAALLLWRALGDRRAAVLYLLCPLVAVEVVAGAHVDAAGMALLLAGFVLYVKRARYLPGAALLALAALVKYPLAAGAVAVVAAEAWRLRADEGFGFTAIVRRLTPSCLLGLGIGAALFLPFLAAGGKLVEQLGIFARYWSFHGPLNWLFPAPGAADGPALRAAFALAALAVTLSMPRLAPAARVSLSLLAVFVPAMAVFPWYLLPFVPFAVLCFRPSGLWLLAALPLTYLVVPAYRADGAWVETPYVTLAAWLPWAVLFLIELVKGQHAPEPAHRPDHPRP